MGRKLSFTGLAGSGGGGGGASGGTYEGTFILDTAFYDCRDENKNFSVTNMDSYFQTFRIRGLDTAQKAYAGWNSMMRNSGSGSSGTMQHVCGLLSVNQSTGAIAKEQITVMHNNPGSPHDYSTFSSCTDEWTGRYCYAGNIPRHGTQHHNGYSVCMLYNANGSSDSSHSNDNTYNPNGNRRNSNAYVAASERKIGGEVKHVITMYNTSGYATAVEFGFGDSPTSLNGQYYFQGKVTKSGTSTNYFVTNFNQWDTSYAEPYYSHFHSFQEGISVRRRSNGNWSDLSPTTDYPMSNDWTAWFMSNGNTLLTDGSSHFKFDTNGTRSVVSSSMVKGLPLKIMQYSNQEMAWNIGQDEWLTILPDMKGMKFKFDPSTMQVTKSNELEITEIAGAAYNNRYNYISGFWSRFSPTSVNPGGLSATYGTENSLGHGFGREKLFYIGGDSSGQFARAATFAIKDLCDTLTYP